LLKQVALVGHRKLSRLDKLAFVVLLTSRSFWYQAITCTVNELAQALRDRGRRISAHLSPTLISRTPFLESRIVDMCTSYEGLTDVH
jgi:hypothetical protein